MNLLVSITKSDKTSEPIEYLENIMLIKEEQKLWLQSGEFIHTIANELVDGTISIEGVDKYTSQIIMEISEALRRPHANDAYAPLLMKEGFFISQNPRSSWIEIATRLVGKTPETSVSDVIKQVRNVMNTL